MLLLCSVKCSAVGVVPREGFRFEVVGFAGAPTSIPASINRGVASLKHRISWRRLPSVVSMRGPAEESGNMENQPGLTQPSSKYVSTTITSILGLRIPRRDTRRVEGGGKLRRAMWKLVDWMIVWPGETVGSWVLQKVAQKEKKIPSLPPQEILAQLRDAPERLAPGFTAPKETPTNRASTRPAKSTQSEKGRHFTETGRMDALMQRYSARRPGEAPLLPEPVGSDTFTARSGETKDRYMQLLDSYARRHEDGDGPQAVPGSKMQTQRKKPIFRSKFADLGKADFGKEGNDLGTSSAARLDQSLQTSKPETRLDQLISRYGDRMTERQTGKGALQDKIVRKTTPPPNPPNFPAEQSGPRDEDPGLW